MNINLQEVIENTIYNDLLINNTRKDDPSDPSTDSINKPNRTQLNKHFKRLIEMKRYVNIKPKVTERDVITTKKGPETPKVRIFQRNKDRPKYKCLLCKDRKPEVNQHIHRHLNSKHPVEVEKHRQNLIPKPYIKIE